MHRTLGRGVIEMLRPAAINNDDPADRGLAYQEDTIREHTSRLAEAVAKHLSEQNRLKTADGMSPRYE